jgi:hypothetical protein
VPSSSKADEKKEKQGGLLGRFRNKRKEAKDRKLYLFIRLI